MNFRNIISALIMVLMSSQVFGQSPLPKGKTQLNVGVGLSEWGVPFYIGLDHGVHKNVSLGAELSYRAYREYWKKNYYNHKITGFSGNVNYHFNTLMNIPSNWDFYAGANLGFYMWSKPHDNYDGTHSSGLGLGGQIGGRYFFTNKVGVNLEFGGGNAFSGGKLGVTVKL